MQALIYVTCVFIETMRMRRLLCSLKRMEQPQWHRPVTQSSDAAQAKLALYNTLTRSKDAFIPLRADRVSWYSCGPTVYDSAHMGHARNYVTIDINRRLLQDYFGYNVEFVQNVTDIDDKIIVRARQNYLFAEFSKAVKQTGLTDKAQSDVRHAADVYIDKYLPSAPHEHDEFVKWAAETKPTQQDPKFDVHVNAIKDALSTQTGEDVDTDTFLKKSESVMVYLLDKQRGSEVTDPQIFRQLSSFYERDFNQDMAALNVLPPSVTTRVSEYIPEIVAFVKQIVDRKLAYKSADGSVYFDVAAFEKAGHDYAKLQPWNKGSQELIDDGEGSLSLGGTKKSNADFALWKSSKAGEPRYPSPWGEGRPGWHIECSVMASHVLGSEIDIHSGGIDLAFPHHDNELAQSEACFGNQQWVNYFLHTGHLHIEGHKMSKSLKNFITIKDALKLFSPRQLRLAFAMQQWNNPLDFKMSMPHVKALESTLTNFFRNVKALERDQTQTDASKHFSQPELDLVSELRRTKAEVHAAFCDSLNTPLALQLLAQLVQKCNEYISRTEPQFEPKYEPLVSVGVYVTRILNVVGFETDAYLGWASEEAGGNREETALPFVQVASALRDAVRALAIKDSSVPSAELLNLCDKVRDVDLFELGVAIDDRGADQSSLVKFLSEDEKQEVLAQRLEAVKLAEEKKQKKAAAAALRAKQEAEKREKARVPAKDMFVNLKEYSKFNEFGLPTHDSSGEPLSKSAIKKLQKLYDQQDKLHKQYFTES